MRILARRWLTDLVTFSDNTFATDTRPIGKAVEVDADAVSVPALVRQASATLVDGQTVRRDVRELSVWVDDSYTTPTAGQRCTFVTVGDDTLCGKFGEVTAVDRDAIRAVRRLTVRIANDD
jgi:hypothetical protein